MRGLMRHAGAVAAAIVAIMATPPIAAATDEPERLFDVEVALDLKEGMFVREAGIAVRFEEVLEDSRCPEDVECVWQGNARILIIFAEGMANGPRFEVELDTANGMDNEGFLSNGLGVRLLALAPLPTIDGNPDRYTATLLLFRPAN